MTADLTPVMGDEDRRLAEQLSLQGARPPVSVPGYLPERFLGRGAYGEVWVARDANTDVRVAIKFFTHGAGSDWSLLAREVDKLRSLAADRYAVQLLKVGWDSTPPYYVMEYLEHGSLEDRLAEGALPAAEAVPLFREIANAVVHAHAKGILHCDLKPANILLDLDDKPRLADFGQARLAGEPSPALGTLFYMAPEQAHSEAVPDARWDVYAMGAVFYRALTGRPPYQSDENATAIRQQPKLRERLTAYRKLVEASPPPAEHRRTPGVDRRLADIVDRCLSVKAGRRFPTAQAVLDALDTRALARARRPLLVVGIFGPILLFVIMAFFAWRAVDVTFDRSNRQMADRVLDGNRFAAHFLAQSVARQLDRRLRILEQVASDDPFRDLLRNASGKPRNDPARRELQARIDHLCNEFETATHAHVWFCDDANGTRLAFGSRDPKAEAMKARALDHSFAYRTYFHGGDRDLEKTAKPPPLKESFISPVFRATTTGELTVVFSTPVWSADEGRPNRVVLGVLGMSLQVGQRESEAADDTESKKWSLVDLSGGRDGQPGMFLQHSSRLPAAEVAKHRCSPEVVKLGTELFERAAAGEHPAGDEDFLRNYADKMGDQDPDFRGVWLAAVKPVILRDRPNIHNARWLVVVQERKDQSIAPLDQIREPLMRYGVRAVALVVVALGALWLFVVLERAPRSRVASLLRRRAGLPSGSAASTSDSSSSVARTPASGRE